MIIKYINTINKNVNKSIVIIDNNESDNKDTYNYFIIKQM